MNVGEYVSLALASLGIEVVFGIPGVHTVELYRGLPASGLRHITPRHEQGAGFMADGYARATGKPAACYIITGPGMTNIATAMAQARGDSVPMLVISSVNNLDELGRGEGRLHELPSQHRVVQGLAMSSQTIGDEAELPEALERAFVLFETARPGPVHIEIPMDILTRPAEHLPMPVRSQTQPPAPDAGDVEAAADCLRAARDPVVILGGGTQNASGMAVRLVETLAAPAILTVNAKGVLAPDHPLNAGSVLSVPKVLERIQRADVVLAIGTELGETDTWLLGSRPAFAGKLIRIDIDPAQLQRNAAAAVGITADAGLAMEALCDALADLPERASAAETIVTELRLEAEAARSAEAKAHQSLMEAIANALPNAVIVGDSTQPIYTANEFYDAPAPRSYFNSSTGYGTLGYALPAAIGAKVAQPDRPVVCVVGDGGLQFSISELASAVELGSELFIIVWNNNGYGEIAKFMKEADVPLAGVELFTPDLVAIASGYGCKAASASGWGEFEDILRRGRGSPVPTFILINEHGMGRQPADRKDWREVLV